MWVIYRSDKYFNNFQLAGFDPSNHSSGFSSFRMASHFLECLGLEKFGVDVVSDAENIKKLLRMPYSKNAVSMVQSKTHIFSSFSSAILRL